MLAKKLLGIMSLLFISIRIPSFASETELAVGKTREGVVGADKPQCYDLVLNAGDYAEIKLYRPEPMTAVAGDFYEFIPIGLYSGSSSLPGW